VCLRVKGGRHLTKSPVRSTDFLLFTVVLMWGAHFAVVKQALAAVDPMAFSVIRFAAASACLFAVVLYREKSVRLDRRDWLPVLLLGALGGTNQVMWMFGLQLTTSGKSALLLAAAPAFVALLRALGGERIGIRATAALVVAFAGVALIVRPAGGGAGGPGLARGEFLGDILTLGAALAWGLYTNTGPHLLRRYSPVRITAYVFGITALITAIPGLGLAMDTSWTTLPAAAWLQLGYSTFLAGALSWVLWYQGVSQLGPVRVMLYQYLVPVVALAISVFLLAEPLLPIQAAGACLVLLGTLGARLALTAPARSPVAEEREQSVVAGVE
jgi:drug/metabolite transporter (DMT)-like permease